MKIKTHFDYPPIPIRSMDWSACFDGEEEDGPYGRGATEEAAVFDLLETALFSEIPHIQTAAVQYAIKGWKAEKEETQK